MDVSAERGVTTDGSRNVLDSPTLGALRVHVVSETPYVMKGQGVHTAFVDCVDLLREEGDVEVVVNEEGWGTVMHAHTYGPYFFWKARRYRGRRVFTVHVIPDSARGSLPFSKLLMPFVRWYLRKVYSYADVCIAISPTVESAIRELGVRTRVVRLVNPISAERFAPSAERRAAGRRLLGLDDQEFLVLGVGQIEGRKGVDAFIETAAACRDLSFVWVGGRPFGFLTEGIRRLNRKMASATANLRFAGPFELEQMPLIYAAADVLLFPSFQENCPLAPLEAAAADLPVVFRDIPELSRLYEAPYIKAREVAGLVSLVRRLASEPSFYRYARGLSRRLVAQFDKRRVRRELLSLYQGLAGSAGAIRSADRTGDTTATASEEIDLLRARRTGSR